jgi:hypothetical protein
VFGRNLVANWRPSLLDWRPSLLDGHVVERVSSASMRPRAVRISAFGAGGGVGLAGRLRGDGMAGSAVGRISPPASLAHEGGHVKSLRPPECTRGGARARGAHRRAALGEEQAASWGGIVAATVSV